jgi:autotransporter-associated beta strand protein
VGAAQGGTFTVTDANASNSPQTGSVSVDVFDHASRDLTTGTLTLGNHHVGYTSPVTSTNNLTVNNAAGFRVDLKGSTPAVGNISVGSVSGIVQGTASSLTASLATGQGAGPISQGFTYTFADDSVLSGASANVGTASLTVTGNIYTGQGVWNVDGNGTGNWSDFGNWTTAGGVPGIDGAVSAGDTATFGSVPADSNPRVISLNGTSPSLAAITFNSAAQPYTINGTGGGTIALQASATVTNTNGNHTISAPVNLGNSNTVGVSVANLGDTLTLSGVLTGTGANLTKTGSGVLALAGANTYQGATNINAGTLLANNTTGSATGAGTVNIGATGTLGGTGTITGPAAVVTVTGTITGGAGKDQGATALAQAAPGLLSTTGGNQTLAASSQVWTSTGTYAWKVKDPTVATSSLHTDSGVGTTDTTAGLNWDMLKIESLNVNTPSNSPFTINGIAPTNASAAGVDQTWTIADITSGVVSITNSLGTTTKTYNVNGGFADAITAANQLAIDLGLTGANPPLLQLITASLPPAPVGGSYSLGVIPDGGGASGGDDLVISFSPTPEPTVLTLLIPGIAGLALRRRRRGGTNRATTSATSVCTG